MKEGELGKERRWKRNREGAGDDGMERGGGTKWEQGRRVDRKMGYIYTVYTFMYTDRQIKR